MKSEAVMGVQAWWSELVTDGVSPPGRFAHAAAGAGETMYVIGGYSQGEAPPLHGARLLLCVALSVGGCFDPSNAACILD